MRCKKSLVNSLYVYISTINKYNSKCSLNKSYCLIRRGWGKNRLHKEEKTTEEETVQLISPSPLWLQQSPDNTETREDVQSEICWIKARVSREHYHLERKCPLHCASAGQGVIEEFSFTPVSIYTRVSQSVTTSWIKWNLPTLSTITLTFPVCTK